LFWIAHKMLMGNRGKFVGMIVGVSFAALLIGQQASVFCGIMWLTTTQIREVKDASIWVMNPNVEYIDDTKPLKETDLLRIRGVPGVAWAVKLYKGMSRARLENGSYQQVILLGIDDASLIGAPRDMMMGSLDELRRPDAVIMDDRGYRQIWPDGPMTLGREFEMNDRRAVVAGICRVDKTFQRFPVIYTRYSEATAFVPIERKVLTFVLAQPAPGVDAHEVCRRIAAQTGMKAMTKRDFAWKTVTFYIQETGIPINFAITVLIGFLVGTAITGQTFYMFTIENLRQFGTLKAMGTRNSRIVLMVLFQAVLVGLLGFGIGMGMSAAFGDIASASTRLAFLLPWQVMAGTGVAVLAIILLSSVISVRRVLVLEPATVFQGN
jgi:putative ABC transport system permease protein